MNLPDCVICFAPVGDGVFTPCCNTTYCKACLNSWLIKHHNCPQCRKALQNVSQTIPVSRILARLNITTDKVPDKVPPSEKEIKEFIETVASNSSSQYHVAQFKKDFEDTLSRVPTLKEINTFIRLQGQLNLPTFSNSQTQYPPPPPPPVSDLLISPQSIVFPRDDDTITTTSRSPSNVIHVTSCSPHHQSQSSSTCSVSPPMRPCSRASQRPKSISFSPSSPSVRSLPTPPYALASFSSTSPQNSNNNQTMSSSSFSSNSSSPQNTYSQLLRPVYSNQLPSSPSYSSPSTVSSSSSSPSSSFPSSSSSSSSFSSSSLIMLSSSSSSSSSSRTFVIVHVDATFREQRQYHVSCVASCCVSDMVSIFKSVSAIQIPSNHTFYVCAYHLPSRQYLRFPLNAPIASIPENSCLFISSTRNAMSAFFLIVRIVLPPPNTNATSTGTGAHTPVNTSIMIASNDVVVVDANTNTNANVNVNENNAQQRTASRRGSRKGSRSLNITGLNTTTATAGTTTATTTNTSTSNADNNNNNSNNRFFFIPFLYPNETMLIAQNVVQFVEDNILKQTLPRKLSLSFSTSNNGRVAVFPTEGIPPYALTTETIVYVD